MRSTHRGAAAWLFLPLLLAAAAAVGGEAPVDPPEDSATRLVAFQQRQQAADAAGAAGRAALLATLEAEAAARPDDPLLRAWLGSARTLQAIDAPLRQKLDWMRKGGADLDAAVAAAPGDAAVRLTRAQHGLAIPRIFGRHRLSHTDFEVLARTALDPATSIPPRLLPLIQQAAGAYWLDQRDPRCLPLLRAAIAAHAGEPDPELLRLLERAESDPRLNPQP